MKITLLSSDATHPVNAYLERWIASNNDMHSIKLVRSKADATGGEILFLISCNEIIAKEHLDRYRSVLVLHASDLPEGRGWSPHVWEISQGAEIITLSLLEAAEEVDSGRLWKKIRVSIPKDALWDEINALLFRAEIDLIDFAIENFRDVKPWDQSLEAEATYYPRRSPEDSQICPNKTISEQFDQIRVCDPIRFPAFFEYLGHRYILKLEKVDDSEL